MFPRRFWGSLTPRREEDALQVNLTGGPDNRPGGCGEDNWGREATVKGKSWLGSSCYLPHTISLRTLKRPAPTSGTAGQGRRNLSPSCGSGRTSESFLHYSPAIEALALTAKISASKNRCLLVQQMSPNVGCLSAPVRVMETNACPGAERAPLLVNALQSHLPVVLKVPRALGGLLARWLWPRTPESGSGMPTAGRCSL